MVAENRALATRVALWLLCAATVGAALMLFASFWPDTLHGQTGASSAEALSQDMRGKLQKRGDLMLRDATVVEAMFIIQEKWGVNIVVGNDAKEAVNGSFQGAPLHEVLDTLLGAQGYGYRVVGDSLVVMRNEQLGAKKPLFETVRIPLQHVDPEEVVKLIEFLLSPDGKAHAVPSARSIVVMDFPERIEQIRQQLLELDDAAAVTERQQEEEAQRAADQAANRDAQRRAAAQVVNPATVGASNSQSSDEAPPAEQQTESESEQPAAGNNTSNGTNDDNETGSASAAGSDANSPPSAPTQQQLIPGTQLTQAPIPGIGASDTTGGTGAESIGASSTDVEDVPELDVAIFEPQYVEASTIVESLATIVSEYGQVTAIPEENRIVAIDQQDYLKRMQVAVKQLDRLRRQVRISAIIFDASLDDLENIGVNLTHTARGRNLDANGVAQDSITLGTLLSPNPGATAVNGSLTALSLSRNVDVNAVVNLLRTSNKSQLLADPTVVVMNRESARIEIVTEIPYQQLTESAQGGSIGTTAFREAGVTLEVTPRIADNGLVNLVVTPQFSVLTGFTEEDNQPIIDRRAAQTVVTIEDQQTLVIGGLRQRSKVRNRAAVPYLSDMKFIGPLFRQRSDEIRESELLVFLTPTIITPEHFGTCREQRAFEFSKCELEQVDEDQCYRCDAPEDRQVYTNSDFSYSPVHIHDEVVAPVAPADQSTGRPQGSPDGSQQNQSMRLPAGRRRSEATTNNLDQGLPPVTAPTPELPTPTTSTRRNRGNHTVGNQPVVAPALPVQQAERANTHPPRTAQAQPSERQRGAAEREPQRIAQNPIRRYTHLPPVMSVPPQGPVSVPGAVRPTAPAVRHAAPGGLSKPIGSFRAERTSENNQRPVPQAANSRPAAPGGMTRPIGGANSNSGPKVIRGNQAPEIPEPPARRPQEVSGFFTL